MRKVIYVYIVYNSFLCLCSFTLSFTHSFLLSFFLSFLLCSDVVQDNPVPLPYLIDPTYGSYDIHLSVALQNDKFGKDIEKVITSTNYRHMYWNAKQQLVHHSVTGCNMRPGDLCGNLI